MLEQFWYQGPRELILVNDDERVSFLGPPYQTLLGWIFQKAMNFSFASLTEATVPYLLSFCTNGGICLRLASASLFARRACWSRSSSWSR